MIIQHSMPAANAARQMNITERAKRKSTEKLSSGYRINRAADDAAGLAVSEKMRKQIRGLGQASDNVQDGISLCQVADGALSEVTEMLHRITELSVQAANGTNSEQDRQDIQVEINELIQEIDRISDATTFNERKIFAGDAGSVSKSEIGRLPVYDIQDSLDVAVTSTTAQAGDYTLKTDITSGISLMKKGAGNTLTEAASFAWSDVKNLADPTKTLADATITPGTYGFEKDGISFTFDVSAGSSVSDIADALEGAEFTIQKDSYTLQPVTSTERGTIPYANRSAPMAEQFWDKLPWKMQADEDGIWMKAGDGTETQKATWASMGVSADTIAGKTLTYTCPDTGYTWEFSVDAKADLNDVAECLSKRTISRFYSSDGETLTNYYNWNESTNIWLIFGQKMNVSGDFVSGYFTNTERTDVDMHHGFHLTGDSLTGAKIEWNISTDYDKTKNVTLYLEPDAVTKSLLQQIENAGGLSVGERVTLAYTDGTNSFSWDIQAKKDCTAGQVLTEIGRIELGYNYVHQATDDSNLSSVTHTNLDVSDILWHNRDSQTTDGISNAITKNGIWIQSTTETNEGMVLEIEPMNTGILGIRDLNVYTVENAEKAMQKTNYALQRVSRNRSWVGAQQNRLEHAAKNLDNTEENTTAAESRIRDTDMAKEMVDYSRHNILAQAGQSMLAQAQQSNQGVLKLLS